MLESQVCCWIKASKYSSSRAEAKGEGLNRTLSANQYFPHLGRGG